MPIQFDLPRDEDSIIKVIGVGGGGSNAVNHMFNQGIVGVNFVICNTDAQSIEQSAIPSKIQLGPGLTEGRGAGSQPEIGKNATLESIDEIKRALGDGTKMVFITAGMGGGTGTGGAPVVAKAAREMGILTVGIVTSPFGFEGRKRIMQAEGGIKELKDNVDTLIVISNDKMRDLYGNLTLSNAFSQADNILATAAKGIAEIITVPGYVNVDFEDVNTVMKNSGVAIMGTGIADGEDRALKAVRMALSSPLLNDNDICGAKHILLNISSGNKEVLMDEVGEITNYIQESAGYTSEVIWGNCVDELLEDKISVTVIATGFESSHDRIIGSQKQAQEKVVHVLEDAPIHHNDQVPSFRQESETDEREPFYSNQEPKQEQTFPQYNFKRRSSKKIGKEDEMKLLKERRNRLRGLNLKLNPNELVNLEKEPAYKRRSVELEVPPHSSESNVSKYTLFEDDNKNPEIRRRNSFLHDNVD